MIQTLSPEPDGVDGNLPGRKLRYRSRVDSTRVIRAIGQENDRADREHRVFRYDLAQTGSDVRRILRCCERLRILYALHRLPETVKAYLKTLAQVRQHALERTLRLI